ncbi:MAG: TonB-dependent receptor plug domain-containing protein, partial [Myxococcota bacterium]
MIAASTAPQASSIEEITVTAPDSASAASAETWSAIPEQRLMRSDARFVADVLRRAPGALVQTNSRGETLVFLRNSGERQVSIFFDGAPLEVPWDHRVDLKLLPAAAIGRVEVARGPLSNRYGPNVSGGAVFLAPFEVETDLTGRLQSEVGLANHLAVKGSLSGMLSERTAVTVAAEHTEFSGAPLASALPFSQPDDALRTNTDARRTSALAH